MKKCNRKERIIYFGIMDVITLCAAAYIVGLVVWSIIVGRMNIVTGSLFIFQAVIVAYLVVNFAKKEIA